MATSGQWVQWATSSRRPIRNAPLRLEPAILAGSFFAEISLGLIVLCVLDCSRVLILYLLLTLFSPTFLRVSVLQARRGGSPRLRGEYWVWVVTFSVTAFWIVVRTRIYIPSPG